MAAHSLRECRGSDGLFADLGYPAIPRLARKIVGVVGRRDRFFDWREAVARIEPMDAAPRMRVRVRVRVCALDSRSIGLNVRRNVARREMWQHCGYRRVATSNVACRVKAIASVVDACVRLTL